MPPILTATIRSDSQRGSTDRTQLCVVLAVVGIVLIQTFLAIAYIRFHNLSSKARWRRLRERGVVFVNGPALIWTNTLPPAPLTSTFNLHHIQQISREQVARYQQRAVSNPTATSRRSVIALLPPDHLPTHPPDTHQ
ncbi:hypothetical protein P3342_001440 [Pyrenophora teres f. teres]|uniref:Uncharacterized protein n=1 Tax=Pyrenophora teres f. teres (strain 0-1) TaxID=861557 RepID=E3S488_PYRTT|nr:hypothetical protein PTT_17342 [Pyrenophora teres f. teres 0-1]KAK1918521.1 hypothetical protein P3342_001440 [Pyrenophora teres f. teres]